MIFQDRTAGVPIDLSGNGGLTITGTIYAAAATVRLTGNGGLDASGNSLDTAGSRYIVDDLKVAGNGSIRITSPADTTKSSTANTSVASGQLLVASYQWPAVSHCQLATSIGFSSLFDTHPTALASSNIYGIVAAVGPISVGTIGTTSTARHFKQNDTLDQAVFGAVFSQGMMPLDAADLFDENAVGDLLNLDQIILNLTKLRASNGMFLS